MKKVSLIIPCYNEEQALPIFAGELDKVRQELRQYDFEVLMVNDGSSDKTLETMKKISEEYDYFKYLSFSRNFGKEAAMYAGFCNADGDYVAVMDADMQDPPSLLPEMLGILEQGEYDSVATRRVTRKGEPPIRSWFARMFYKIINKISDADVVDGARDFRLMKAEMKDAIVSMCEYNRFSKGIFGWIGFRTKWLEYENVERVAGETKWNFWKLLSCIVSHLLLSVVYSRRLNYDRDISSRSDRYIVTYHLISQELHIIVLKSESVVFCIFAPLLQVDDKIDILIYLNALNTKQ